MRLTKILCGVLAGLGVSGLAGAQLDNGFTYQGRLVDGGAPADGDYEVRLEFFDAQTGGTSFLTIPFQPVTAEDGLFTVGFSYVDELFDRPGRVFVEIAVRPAGAGGFTVLSPRQRIDAAPLADKANIAEFAIDAPATTLTEAYAAGGGTLTTDTTTGRLDIEGFGGTRFSHGANGRVEFDFSTGLFGVSNNGVTQWSITNSPNQFLASLPADTNGQIAEFGGNPFNDGGRLFLFPDTNENRSTNGGGAFLYGNRVGNGDGGLRLNGPQSSMTFSTNDSGDNAVQLPQSSISPLETSAEAGLDAFESDNQNTYGSASSGQEIDILTDFFTAPADGFLVIISTAEIEWDTATSLGVLANFGISVDEDFGPTQDLSFGVDPSVPGTEYRWSPTAHRTVPVSGGQTYRISMVFQPTISNTNDIVRLRDKNLTMMYFPTLYGEFSPTLVAGGNSSLGAPVDGSAAQSAQGEVDRLQREVEAMRQRMEALEDRARRAAE